MSFPKKAKVVIVGGGIHGLSTAWKLSETYKNPGDIVVVEKEDTAAGASGIACGVVRNTTTFFEFLTTTTNTRIENELMRLNYC